MTDWNNLEEKYISGEDLEVLNCRRKEIETRRKQDYLDKVCRSVLECSIS